MNRLLETIKVCQVQCLPTNPPFEYFYKMDSWDLIKIEIVAICNLTSFETKQCFIITTLTKGIGLIIFRLNSEDCAQINGFFTYYSSD